MDILAAMLAYLVSVTAIVGALGISLFVFFSAPDREPPLPQQAKAMVVAPRAMKTAAADAKAATKSEKIAKDAARRPANPVTTIAVDARQKPLTSPAELRRLADRERARRLAAREGSDFEARFLRNED